MALPTIGGNGTISASYLNQLIQLSMSQARRPLAGLNREKDSVNLTKTAYQGLDSRFNALNDVLKSLLVASGSAGDSIFTGKSVSASNAEAVNVTVSQSAAVGTYSINVTSLAKNHRVRSEQQAHADQPLGLTGTFVIGGAAARGVSNENTVADTVTGFGTHSIAGGQKELGSGTYYVEVRENDGAFQFRIVDGSGKAISVAKATDAAAFTTDWQNVAAMAGATFNTGRGLTVDFGSGPYTAGMMGSGAASVQYTAQGHAVSVTATMSLNDIRAAINSATFADGMDVQATMVDKQLVLTRLQGGSANRVIAADISGAVLSGTGANGLGILGDGGAGDVDGGDGFRFTLQQAASATFTVNGISVTRNGNTGLTDVAQGLTLDLLKEGASAEVTVKTDMDAIVGRFKSLASNFNNLVDFLKQQSAVTVNADNTYKRGALAGDSLFGALRFQLINDLNARPTGLSADAPAALDAIGLTFNGELNLSVSNEGKLKEALAANFEGVRELVNAVLTPLSNRLAPYIGATGVIASSMTTFDNRVQQIDGSIKAMNERLTAYEAALTKQYGALLGQLAQTQASANSAFSIMGLGNINLLG